MREIKALVIIPAKADSKRLVGKNKRVIAGKTLVDHAILYAKESNYCKEIILTTEDEETSEIAKKHGVKVVGRDASFMGEREVADVYVDVFKGNNDQSITHVVGVQPDHPDRTVALDIMLEYVVDNKYDDFFTVNEDGSRNGSIRITKSEHVKSEKMSRRVGSMFDFCTNIHSEEDLRKAERNILSRVNTINE